MAFKMSEEFPTASSDITHPGKPRPLGPAHPTPRLPAPFRLQSLPYSVTPVGALLMTDYLCASVYRNRPNK